MKNILLSFISLIVINSLHAQQWQVYNTSNSNIPADTPWEAVHSSDGSTWIGMKLSGLTHFNNNTWTTYNTSNSNIAMNGVLGLNIDNNNKIWLTLNSYGLQTFDGTTWDTPDGTSLGVDFSNVTMRPLINYLGDVYIGTNYGLAIFDGTNWTLKNMSNSNILDTLLTGNNKPWDVASDGTIWYNSDQIVYSYNPITDVANSYDANDHGIVNWWNNFETIFVDQNDVVWIGVEQIGLITFDGTTWTTVANNPLTRVLEIGEDSNGDLWYTGGFNTSIIKYDKNVTFTEYVVNGTDVFDGFVSSITKDANGDMWFTYDGKGAVTFGSSTPTSVIENPSTSLGIYPNPTNGIINITNMTENTTVKVFNLSGQIVKETSSNRIDLSNLENGMYFIAIENEVLRITKK